MVFYLGAASFLLGLVLGISVNIPLVYFLSYSVILFGLVLVSWQYFLDFFELKLKLSLKKHSIIIGIFVAAFFFGDIYQVLHQPSTTLMQEIGKKNIYKGIIIEEPIPKERSTHIVVKIPEGKVLLFADSYPVFEYGDEVLFTGKIKLPESFATDSGRMFNYPGYLSKDNIFFISSYPKIEKISGGNGNIFKTYLYALKSSIIKNMEKVVPFPESTLLQGITLSGKKALPANIEDKFRRAGVSHIVVLSGYNVTIVALIVMKLLSRFPRRIAFSFSSLGIAAFCVLAGGSSTIVRAGIMSFLFLFSKFVRRDADGTRLLLIAGCLMALINPRILLYDISFHLSFLATFGLINLSPYFENKFSFIPDSLALREIVASSIAVEIFLLPYLAYSMGNIAVLALISNILLLSFIPVTMLFGFLASGLVYLNIKIGAIAGFLSFFFLRYELQTVSYLSSFPYALLNTPVSIWVPIIFYILSLATFLLYLYVVDRIGKGDFKPIDFPQLSNLSFQKKLQRILSFLKEVRRAYMNAPTYQDRE